jgi:multicomponent Na+:H+ antiporter subunit A
MSLTSAHSSSAGSSYLWVALLPLTGFIALVWGLLNHPLPWHGSLDWIPSLGVSFAVHIDGLSAQFLALILGIGTLVFVYASGYMAGEPRRGRLFLILILFMLAMVGAVSADHLLVLFLFWELTSLTSFLLAGFYHDDERARSAARQALLVTMGGGLALLAAILLLAEMAGSYSLRDVIARGPDLAQDPRLPAALLLLFMGCFTKSAQFPFHFWLPNAMAAPTPVSAYLHSATMVKLGVYLLARLDPAFNDLFLWEAVLIGVGTLTAVWGAVLALRERDLKRILAWSTVSALGTLTLLIGLPNPGAGLAVAAFLFAHALYKAPLFMVAGNIDHATGTRVIDRLMGLGRAMPWTAAAALLAGLSMAGLPLSFGFVAKDLITVAKIEADLLDWVSYATLFVNATAAAVAGIATLRIFGGSPPPISTPTGNDGEALDRSPSNRIREAPWTMVLPPLLIALIGIEFEFLPDLADPLLAEAGLAIAPDLGTMDVATSYQFGTMLTATEIALLVGLVLFLIWDWLHRLLHRVHWLDRIGPEATYERALRGLTRIAAWQTRLLQPGRLTAYLRWTLASLLALAVGAGLAAGSASSFGLADSLDLLAKATATEWRAQGWAWSVAAVLIVAGAAASVALRDRMALLMASGLVGYGSAVLFLFAGAPDLAFTQFAVETALVVVAAALLPRYGKAPRLPDEPRVGNALLAITGGASIFVLVMWMLSLPLDPELANWFGKTSLPQAHGHNVVNVIIVDFRALDTLGEIAVVAFSLIAALPVLGALARNRGRSP